MADKTKVRRATLADIPQLMKVDEEIWPQFRADEQMFRSRISVFPEGQFVATHNRQVVGSVFSQLVSYEDWVDRDFTWDEVTDKGTLRRTHNPKGDSIYGVGLAVTRRFQSSSVSRLLIVAAVQLVIRRNYQRILLGSRIPGYWRHRNMPVEEYIRTKNQRGRFLDPELALYQKYKGEPIKALPGYISDPASLDFGVLIDWENPLYGKIWRFPVGWFLNIFPSVIW